MNAITLPDPIAHDETTVTLSRAAWETLIAQIEDAEDKAAATRFTTRVEQLGLDELIRQSYTAAETDQVLDGTPLLVIWRRRAGLTQSALAKAAGISSSYLAEIEGGKKPGSLAAMSAVAKALGVPLDTLVG
jgi:DNA-binding XRE family transcriptional regulator